MVPARASPRPRTPGRDGRRSAPYLLQGVLDQVLAPVRHQLGGGTYGGDHCAGQLGARSAAARCSAGPPHRPKAAASDYYYQCTAQQDDPQDGVQDGGDNRAQDNAGAHLDGRRCRPGIAFGHQFEYPRQSH